MHLERARAVSLQLHGLFKERRKNHAAIAHLLGEMKRHQLYAYLGYGSLAAYAWDQHQLGKSQACELAGISLACKELPETRAAFDAGELHWTKAREIARVATPATEAYWLGLSRRHTADELHAMRKGEPRKVRRGLSYLEEQVAEYDQLLAGIKEELGVVSDGEAVLELMRRGASGQGGEAPVQRVVITECGTCHQATIESREGPVPVSAEVLAHARCDGELHDLREEPNVVKRTAPARVRRRVLDRDRRRCLVPGCRAMSTLELHHEDGWEQGHDPERMLTLCWSHHRARHLGLLRVRGAAPDFRFELLDGQVLGAFSYENSRLGSVSHEPEGSDVETDVIQDATHALRVLGLKAHEAGERIQVPSTADQAELGPRRSW